jgi:pimeloyl-ACP methyl ester carboxylesterase
VLDRVLARVRADGAERVYLVGLSNGARGAASLARTRGRQLDGVVVISGAAPVAPPRGVPVLAVQGRDDRMFPSRFARGYARSAGRSGTYAPIDGGHFVFLDRWTDVEGAVTTWLSHLET